MSGDTADAEQGLISIEKRWLQGMFYGGLLVWLLYLLGMARSWTWEDKLMPYIAGVATGIFLLVRLVKIFFPDQYESLLPDSVEGTEGDLKADLEEVATDEAGRPTAERHLYALYMIGWAIALPVGMYFIGFANALPLFILFFGLQFYDDATRAVLMTVAFSVFMYVFFILIIGMQPWDGTLGIPSILKVLGLL